LSQILINDYLKQLDIIKKVSGSQRETIVREAFKDLLKAWGKQQGLIFLAEYPLKTATKSNINVDGALLHELRMPIGYWEAKDADDDLAEDGHQEVQKGLEPYYAAIRATAAQISSHGEKQTFLKVIYENFYKVYNAKAADRLGVVYTPGEIVRFMIDGADWLCEKHFGKNLIDKDVDILDPATGTDTFICELLEHFRGQPKKLIHKYKHELHANEVAILPYYVANLNIESTFAAITGSYEEFPNLCFVDTLDNVGPHTAEKGVNADLCGSVSEENVARIKRQNTQRQHLAGHPGDSRGQGQL